MNSENHRKLYLGVCLSILTLFIFIYYFENLIPGTPFLSIEEKTYDFRSFYGKKIIEDPRLIFLAVDRPNYSHEYPQPLESLPHATQLIVGAWPWSREVWSLAIDRLVKAGAKVIALDLIFKTEGVGDPFLKKTLLQYSDHVVLGLNIQVESENSMINKNSTEKTISFDYPTRSIVGSFNDDLYKKTWDSIGFLNFIPDPIDFSVRHIHFSSLGSYGQPIYSFASKILEKMQANIKPQQLPEVTRFRLSYNPKYASEFGTSHEKSFLPISFYQIFDQKIWERNFQSGAFFKDKVIIIGVLGDWNQDYLKTTFPTAIPGPKLHLHALNAALQQAYIHSTSSATDYFTIFLAGLAAFSLLSATSNPRLRILYLICCNLTYGAIAFLFFNHQNLAILCFIPFLTFNSSVFTCNIYEIFAEQKERARVRSHLERYVSKNVVRMLLENPQQLEGRKAVTILFSDLRGFTTLTESAEAEALVKQLNEYLTKMVKCVFQNRGTLDKFIGDAVMAVWGNVESEGVNTDAQRAVQCSLDMIDELRKLNIKWKLEGKPELKVGIGINHGQAIVANMGSEEAAHRRVEFTVIGDSVNTAARLEGLTKEYHTELLLGETVEPLVNQMFQLRSVALVQLKGKTKATEVFNVLGKTDPLNPSPPPPWLLLYETAIKHYRNRNFQKALADFNAADALNPHDFLIEEYIDSCHEFIQNPPDEKWTGVIIMKTK